jgi:hypothetical protein
LSDFVRHVNDEPEHSGRRFIFATLDESLREIACIMIGQNSDSSPQGELALSLQQWWPANDAQRISVTWFEYLNQTRDADWRDQHQDYPDYVGETIDQIEQDILAWQHQ